VHVPTATASPEPRVAPESGEVAGNVRTPRALLPTGAGHAIVGHGPGACRVSFLPGASEARVSAGSARWSDGRRGPARRSPRGSSAMRAGPGRWRERGHGKRAARRHPVARRRPSRTGHPRPGREASAERPQTLFRVDPGRSAVDQGPGASTPAGEDVHGGPSPARGPNREPGSSTGAVVPPRTGRPLVARGPAAGGTRRRAPGPAQGRGTGTIARG